MGSKYLFIAVAAALGVLAASPAAMQADLARDAQAADAGFTGFSADRGAVFFTSRHGAEWSCASCHTDNPLATGRHAVTGQAIKPLAPAANPERFSDARKVDKWFRRNCNDVLGRPCTAGEKGDVLAYLLDFTR